MEPLRAESAQPQCGDSDTISALHITPDNLVMTVVKLSEDGNQLLVRGYESEGRAARMNITSTWLRQSWAAEIGAHEIWTFSLPLDGGEATKLNLLEEPIGK
jgi:alpha-mannosidase